MKRSHKIILATLSVALLIGVAVVVGANVQEQEETNSKVTVQQDGGNTSNQKSTAPSGASTTNSTSTEELTLYLIEEEKLAHDVYTVMYQKYGAKVFGNILESESSHQAQVLALLQARNISDPRSSEIGVFKNQELQALYNQLIKQGNISATEAYKVGVIIEEKDIADISAQLATTTESDVVATLEKLRQGSENHLRAFNRQL